MIPALRQRFNAGWSEARYRGMIERLQQRAGGRLEFPVSETPCFFPRALLEQLARDGTALIEQAVGGAAAAAAAEVVPPRYRGAAATEPHPTFLQVDFGLVRNDAGDVEPRLVELQAFPSLYAFQAALADAYAEAFALPADLDRFLGGLTADRYRALLQQAIAGAHDPREVVLIEIDPEQQKTRPDFVLTDAFWGVRAIDARALVRQGSRR